MFEKSVLRSFLFIILFSLTTLAFAQKENIPDFNTDLLEDIFAENESINDPDLVFIYETLEAYYKNPLNLNTASEEDLQELRFLNQLQIQQFFVYKKTAGELISVYELQVIPEWDIKTVRAILPFVQVSGEDQYQLSLEKMVTESKKEWITRWGRVLEEQIGFLPRATTGEPTYEGSPDKILTRIRGNYENRLRFGVTAEKDDSESFFRKSNRRGFDFYSAHFFLKDYSKKLKHLALGDFNASFGQGLIAYSGFSSRKSVDVTNIDRERRVLRYFSSVNETQFLRGAGVTLGLTDHLEATGFGSYKKIDGNLFQNDSLDIDSDFFEFETLTSSLQTSGYHGTAGEIEDEKQIGQLNIGGQLKYKEDTWHIALNSIYHQLDKPLNRNEAPYNQFTFRGNTLLNISTDYSFLFRNIKFFGETAWSDNGSVASVNGLLFGLDQKMSLAVFHRYLPADFWAINSRPFAETTAGSNENGLYLGLEINPNKNWKLQSYFDSWQHPWLRFTASAPSKGVEYFTRLTYKRKRRMEAYLQIKNEIKELNPPSEFPTQIKFLTKNTTTRIRLHVSNELTKAIKLRTRIEWSFFDNEIEPSQKGYLIYQDFIFKPMQSDFSFTTRFALFDTDGWDSRIYAYENNLLYTFSIPAYTQKGTRFYLNVRYRPVSKLTLEFRYYRTFLFDEKTIGSGYDLSLGNVRSGVAAQLQWQF